MPPLFLSSAERIASLSSDELVMPMIAPIIYIHAFTLACKHTIRAARQCMLFIQRSLISDYFGCAMRPHGAPTAMGASFISRASRCHGTAAQLLGSRSTWQLTRSQRRYRPISRHKHWRLRLRRRALLFQGDFHDALIMRYYFRRSSHHEGDEAAHFDAYISRYLAIDDANFSLTCQLCWMPDIAML